MISSDNDESNGPSRSFTPPLKVEENIPFLPEVTSKISLPSNLQEILNSIQKKTEEPESVTKDIINPVEDLVKANNPNIDMALNVLNQTKNLLSGLSATSESFSESARKEDKSSDSKPILSRLTDQELLRKVKEMEMDAEMDNLMQVSSQPMPPGIQDIPLLPSNGAYANPPPTSQFFANNSLLSTGPPVLGESSYVKTMMGETEDKKPEKRMKLDPKSVFESEGVPDFLNVPCSSWDVKKGQKGKNYKIDIKLGMNSLERKKIDMDHFDIESISKVSNLSNSAARDDRHMPSSSSCGSKTIEDAKFDLDERVLIKNDEKYNRGSYERDRRRSDDREVKRDWKYDRRGHWDDGRRYKDDYRRHGRRDRPKFRKDRFDDKRNRHLQKEWDGSIKNFEERQRWRNQEMRRDEMRRLRKRADSSTN